MARDYFSFVTKFFEVIDVSTTHIYHTALALSPLSSIVRKLYYHQRPTPFPRVVFGTPDSWDTSIANSNVVFSHGSSSWSPCGQFTATWTGGAVEIRDALAFELLSTLRPTEPTSRLPVTFAGSAARYFAKLAYSPDGRSLACTSGSTIAIWDIQTGGVAKEIICNETFNDTLVWSSDGRTISTMPVVLGTDAKAQWTVCRYDLASGLMLPPIALRSETKPHLWAHNESLRVMTTRDGEACTVDIFEVGPTLTRIESFPIPEKLCYRIKSFSPATYRISFSSFIERSTRLLALDVRNLGNLLDEEGEFHGHCFSPDGSLFAASQRDTVRIWKYNGGCYRPWRQYPSLTDPDSKFQFSPTSSSILGHFGKTPTVAFGWSFPCSRHKQRTTLRFPSPFYLHRICVHGGCAVTITSLLSPTPSQFIDTDVKIIGLGILNNALFVVGPETVVAWLLTEEGRVTGVFGDKRADRGNSIWTVSIPRRQPKGLEFLIEGETGVIKSDGDILHAYNTRTGEVLGPAQMPLRLNGPWYSILDITRGQHRCYDGSMPPHVISRGWVRDSEGRHLLWLPIDPGAAHLGWERVEWFSDIATIRFVTRHSGSVIAKLY